MTHALINDTNKRHDFVILFDVTDGNPNGDPDAGNLPRVDPETMHGLVTDVSMKRKLRDFIDLQQSDAPHDAHASRRIFIQSKSALNTLIEESRVANKEQAPTDGNADKAAKKSGKDLKRKQEDERRIWMCEQFYDVRAFGAVMSTSDYPAGQVRGPIQLTFARSIDPIVPLDLAITRVAITKADDFETKRTEIGRKAMVPYALYRAHGFFTPHFATQTGFSSEDLALFWEALQHCWELDRSASRGMLALRGLLVFTHEKSLGNAPAHELFERVQVVKRDGVEAPRSFADYQVTIMPGNHEGVTLTHLVDPVRVPAPVMAR